MLYTFIIEVFFKHNVEAVGGWSYLCVDLYLFYLAGFSISFGIKLYMLSSCSNSEEFSFKCSLKDK